MTLCRRHLHSFDFLFYQTVTTGDLQSAQRVGQSWKNYIPSFCLMSWWPKLREIKIHAKAQKNQLDPYQAMLGTAWQTRASSTNTWCLIKASAGNAWRDAHSSFKASSMYLSQKPKEHRWTSPTSPAEKVVLVMNPAAQNGELPLGLFSGSSAIFLRFLFSVMLRHLVLPDSLPIAMMRHRQGGELFLQHRVKLICRSRSVAFNAQHTSNRFRTCVASPQKCTSRLNARRAAVVTDVENPHPWDGRQNPLRDTRFPQRMRLSCTPLRSHDRPPIDAAHQIARL